VKKLVAAAIAAISLVNAGPAQATGFQDLGTCFTSYKGEVSALSDLGKCEIHFYSSYGGGTRLTLFLSGGRKVVGVCMPENLSACQVNDEAGIATLVRRGKAPAYCVWRHRDPIAYCGIPWNRR